ncbi:cysteine peptidase family C39 domain-containing protein, partial [Candidatus Omnitrophota bacterium]
MKEEIKQETQSKFKRWIRAVALLVVIVFVPEQAAWAMGYDPSVLWAPRYYLGSGQTGYLANFVAENVRRSLDFLAEKPLQRVEIASNLVVDTPTPNHSNALTQDPNENIPSWWLNPYYDQISLQVMKGMELSLNSIIRLLEFSISYGRSEKEIAESQAPAKTIVDIVKHGRKFVDYWPRGVPFYLSKSMLRPDSLYISYPLIKKIYKWLREPSTQIDNYCGVYALHNILQYNKIDITLEELALRVILVDLLTGNIKELKGKLKTSFFALSEVAKSLGLKLYPVKLLPSQLINQPTNKLIPFIAHLNSDHFVYVTGISEDGIYYQEKGEEKFIPKIALITEVSGFLLIGEEIKGIEIGKLSEKQTRTIVGGYTYPKSSYQKLRDNMMKSRPGWGEGIPVFSRLSWEMKYPRTATVGSSTNHFTYGDLATVALVVGTCAVGAGATGALRLMGTTTAATASRTASILTTTASLSSRALLTGVGLTGVNLLVANAMSNGQGLSPQQSGQIAMQSMMTGILMTVGFKGLGLVSRGLNSVVHSSRLASFASAHPVVYQGAKWAAMAGTGGTIGVGRGYLDSQFRGMPYSWKQAGVDFGTGAALAVTIGAGFKFIPRFSSALAGTSGTLAKVGSSSLLYGTVGLAGGRLTPLLDVPDPENPGSTRTYLTSFGLPEQYNLGWQGDLIHFGIGAVFGGVTAMRSPFKPNSAPPPIKVAPPKFTWNLFRFGYKAPNVIMSKMGYAGGWLVGKAFPGLGQKLMQHPLKTSFITYYSLSTPYAAYDALKIKPPTVATEDFNQDGIIDNKDLDINADGKVDEFDYYQPSFVRSLANNIATAGGRQVLGITPLRERVKKLDQIETGVVLQSFNSILGVGVASSYAFGLTKFYLASPGLVLNAFHPETLQELLALGNLLRDITTGSPDAAGIMPASPAEWAYLFGSLIGSGTGFRDVGKGIQSHARMHHIKQSSNGFVMVGEFGHGGFPLVGGNLTGVGKAMNFVGKAIATTPKFLAINTAFALGMPLLGSGGDFSALGKSANRLAYNFDSVASSAVLFNTAFSALRPVTKFATNNRYAKAVSRFVQDNPVKAGAMGVGVMGAGATMYYFGAHHDGLKGTIGGNVLANLGLLTFSAGGFLTLGAAMKGINSRFALKPAAASPTGTLSRGQTLLKGTLSWGTGATLGSVSAGAGWLGTKKLVGDYAINRIMGETTYVLNQQGELEKATYEQLSQPRLFSAPLEYFTLEDKMDSEAKEAYIEGQKTLLAGHPELDTAQTKFFAPIQEIDKDTGEIKQVWGLFQGETGSNAIPVSESLENGLEFQWSQDSPIQPINHSPAKMNILGKEIQTGEWSYALINGALLTAAGNVLRVYNKTYPGLSFSRPITQVVKEAFRQPWVAARQATRALSTELYKGSNRNFLKYQAGALMPAAVGTGILAANNLTDIAGDFKAPLNYLGYLLIAKGALNAVKGIGAKYIPESTFVKYSTPAMAVTGYATNIGVTLFGIIPALHGAVEVTSFVFNKFALPYGNNSLERMLMKMTFAAFWDDTKVKIEDQWVERSAIKYLGARSLFTSAGLPNPAGMLDH